MSRNNVAFVVPAVGRPFATCMSSVRSAFRSVTVTSRYYYYLLLLLLLTFSSCFSQGSYIVGFWFCRWPGPTTTCERRRPHAMEDWMAALKVTASRDLLNQVKIYRRGLSWGGGETMLLEVDDWLTGQRPNGSGFNGNVTIRQSLTKRWAHGVLSVKLIITLVHASSGVDRIHKNHFLSWCFMIRVFIA